jgi:hypothetical protein
MSYDAKFPYVHDERLRKELMRRFGILGDAISIDGAYVGIGTAPESSPYALAVGPALKIFGSSGGGCSLTLEDNSHQTTRFTQLNTANQLGVWRGDLDASGNLVETQFLTVDINGYMGLGVERSPERPIHITMDSTTNSDIFQTEIHDSLGVRGSNWRARSSSGTYGSPAPPQADQSLLNINVAGWNGTQWTGAKAQIRFEAAETWTTTSTPTEIRLGTTASGSTSMVTRMFVDKTGSIGMGTEIPDRLLHIVDDTIGSQLKLESTGTVSGLAFQNSLSFLDSEILLAGATYQFNINGTTMLSMDEGNLRSVFDGFVGINGVTPGHPLTIASSSSTAIGLAINARSSDEIGMLRFYGNDGATLYGQIRGDSGALRYTAPGSRSHIFNCNSQDRFGIYPGGVSELVGISGSGNSGATLLITDSASLAAGVGGSIGFRGTDGTTTRSYARIVGAKASATSGVFDGYLAFEVRQNGFGSTTERARITNSGILLVGKTAATSANQGVQIQGDGRISITTSNSGTQYPLLFARAGSASAVGSIETQTSAPTTTYNTSSDERLKENILDAENSGAIIDAIKVRQFDWKDGGYHQDFGFVAQELNPVFSDAVSPGRDEENIPWMVDNSKLVPLMVKELQALRQRVANLEV